MRVENKAVSITGKLIKIAILRDEWYEDVEDLVSLVEQLKKSNLKADIFSFMHRLPETQPKYNYYWEWDNVAAIYIKSFDHWWQKQIPKQTRTHVRKAQKKGIVVKVVNFNEELIKGILDIYNETPTRQGKPFWHFGKDFNTIKEISSTFLERSDFIGAYYKDELIGFIKLVYAGETARTMHIISKTKHRDKSPNNALLAKAVEICYDKGIPYLVYGHYNYGKTGNTPLTIFKSENGFKKIDLPRYYIPSTLKGKIILKLKLHHGIAGILPEKLTIFLLNLRKQWYTRKYAQT